MTEPYSVEKLIVYQKLCDLHIELCDLCREWPLHERFELASQLRRSSNSAPANLAERHNDRHPKNRIEGVNRGRGETFESIHHLYIASRKFYVTQDEYMNLRNRYLECVRMLNGLERSYEHLLTPEQRQRPEA